MANLGNVPTITTGGYASSMYDGTGTAMVNTSNAIGLVSATTTTGMGMGILANQARVANKAEFSGRENLKQVIQNIQKDIEMAKATRRIVKVIIVDTDENVPMEKCVLYSGEEKMTDATDQELFFEIDIKNILDQHNAYRITLKDKSVKERVENLEPVKIRDLRMVVVNVATF